MDLREIIETPVSKLGIVLKKVMMFIIWIVDTVCDGDDDDDGCHCAGGPSGEERIGDGSQGETLIEFSSELLMTTMIMIINFVLLFWWCE